MPHARTDADTESVALAGKDANTAEVLRVFALTLSTAETAAQLGIGASQVELAIKAHRTELAHLLATRAQQSGASRDACVAMLWSMASFDPGQMVRRDENNRPVPLPIDEWPVPLRMACNKIDYNELTMKWSYGFESRTAILKILLEYFRDPPAPMSEITNADGEKTVGGARFIVIGHQTTQGVKLPPK